MLSLSSGVLGRAARTTWAVLSAFILGSIVIGLSVLPAALFWAWHLTWPVSVTWVRIVLLSMAAIPVYMIFACALMFLSALAMRLVGWRTPPDAEMVIRDKGWPLFDWLRYTTITYIVRVLAGTFFQATPVWRLYLRMNGARIGRGVFVNTLAIMDHNLLEFGDHTVIGSGVHLSGHTVEHGVVKTGKLRIGRNVTIGTQSVIGLGARIGDGCQIGALSLVPKHAQLEPGGVYGGIPVDRLN